MEGDARASLFRVGTRRVRSEAGAPGPGRSGGSVRPRGFSLERGAVRERDARFLEKSRGRRIIAG